MSEILYVRDVPREVDTTMFCGVIAEINKPKKVVELKRTTEAKRSFLVEFSNISQSLEVMSLLENYRFNDKEISVCLFA